MQNLRVLAIWLIPIHALFAVMLRLGSFHATMVFVRSAKTAEDVPEARAETRRDAYWLVADTVGLNFILQSSQTNSKNLGSFLTMIRHLLQCSSNDLVLDILEGCPQKN